MMDEAGIVDLAVGLVIVNEVVKLTDKSGKKKKKGLFGI